MNKKKSSFEWTVAQFDALVDLCPTIERKGKTVPYTSANGHMFSFVNKAGEYGIRFSKTDQEKLLEKYNTTLFTSHGATMKGYILIPENLFEDMDSLKKLLLKSHDFVNSLPPK